MAVTYNHHQHRRPLLSFNPSWCLRPPTGDLQFLSSLGGCTPARKKTRLLQQSSAGTSRKAKESSSPRIGCMGQIKHRKAGANPSSAATPLTSARTKFHKLRKMFSDKSMLPASPPPRSSTSSSRAGPDNACDMDPPLPVVRGAAGIGHCEVSLWKRRRAGEALDGIQVRTRRCRPQRAVVVDRTTSAGRRDGL